MTPPKPLGVRLQLPSSYVHYANPGAVPRWIAQFIAGHQQLIEMNPIDVQLQRWTRRRSGPGFEAWTPDPPDGIPAHVRIFQQGGGSVPITSFGSDLIGHQERNTTWGMLLDASVPLRATDGEDGNVRLELEHPVHGRFRLRRLRGLTAGAWLVGWQSDLERIAGTSPEPEVAPAAVAEAEKRPAPAQTPAQKPRSRKPALVHGPAPPDVKPRR